ncbi:filamentous hemagglutinin N-terminal domain-containing protein [Novosphingobium profundi]|uniref:beta strand repeat-containing protein n=1 Tax=Novosphingobium profundi TaxID=1774954 RepID=UPI001BDA57CB|nr:GLUG motif-containing protein [Novosphingobium profundi]MBT0670081.1 filamentous hemagglutinin N-terminal domain-containing protein [Novosphingobium profundi]
MTVSIRTSLCLASARARRGRWLASSTLAPAALVALLGLAPSARAQTLPTGGTVAAGSASIATTGTATRITQTSDKAIINWDSFSVGQGASVIFAQPGSGAATLNRVTGDTASTIAGAITATGSVYLVNPNGIAITSSGTVQTGGNFVASTLDIADEDFLAGKLAFTGSGASRKVSNAGTISAGSGAFVALLGGAVANSGTIRVPLGKLAMGSGEQIALDLNGDNFLQVAVPSALVTGEGALLDNSGTIVVTGGAVVLKAAVLKDAVRNVINMSGTINADSAVGDAGTIHLIGGADTASMAGTVTVSGTLSAQATGAGGNGGFIETSGEHVDLSGIAVSTLAANGTTGTWLIDPTDFTVAASGGDLTGDALSSQLASSNVTILSSQGASGSTGTITIDDAVTWSANTLTLDAYGDVDINAVMTASGTAGFAAIVGDTALDGTGSDSGSLNFGLGSGGFTGVLNLASTGSFSLNGQDYTILTSLGEEGSTTGRDLQGIQGDLAGYYVLGSAIDASATASWNDGTGFAPIGSGSGTFSGSLLGLGHTISDLTIASTSDYIGLFGYASASSTIASLGLVDASVGTTGSYVGALAGFSAASIRQTYVTGAVSGSIGVGGLVGYNNQATIEDSFSNATVTGGLGVGGLVGGSYGGTVTRSYATGSVTGSDDEIGGLIGATLGATISESYATGVVTGVDHVGGLVGEDAGSSTISASYATGAVSGNSSVGGLLGYSSGGTISRSHATGTVTSTSNYTGGLVGYLDSGSIGESYATGVVYSASSVAGGLVGYNTNGAITQSYATGSVTGSDQAGGLVGNNRTGTITLSYATGSAKSNGYTGGLIGYNNGGTIVSSYATGFVDATRAGGLIGYNNAGTITDSYWDSYSTGASGSYYAGSGTLTNVSAVTSDPGQRGASNYAFSASAYGNFDSADWVFLDGVRPMGSWEQAEVVDGVATITNAHQLQLINATSTTLSQSYVLANDIDLSETGAVTSGDSASYAGMWSGAGFIPLGTDADGPVLNNYAGFNGRFDGDGHVLSHLTIVRSSDYTGLFGMAGSAANITAVGIVDARITASGEYSGALAGWNEGTISEAFATGEVSSSSYYVGGLVGVNLGGAIRNVYADVTVTGYSSIGGLAGYSDGTINQAYAIGAVTGSSVVGGLTGYNWGTIANSYWDSYATGQASAFGNTWAAQNVASVSSDPADAAESYYAYKASAWSQFTTDEGASNVDTVGGQDLTWRLYEGYTGPLLKAFLTTATPSSTVVYDSTDRSSSLTLHALDGSALDSSLIYGTASYSCTGGDVSCTNVGTYTAGVGGLYSSQLGYDIVTQGTLTITPASLRITGASASSTYTGLAQTLGSTTVSGLLGSDSVDSVTGTAQGTDVGTYAQILGDATGTGLGNYTITYVDGSLTITPAALTITGNTSQSTYTAFAQANGYTVTGLLGADSVASVAGLAGGTAVGSYADALSGASGTGLSNYTITYVNGGLTIDPAALTITGNTSQSTYTAFAQANGYTVTGLLGADSVASVMGLAEGSAVGSYVDALSGASGTGLSNYTITYVNGALAIDPAALTITGATTRTTYDGALHTNAYSVSGLLGSDGVESVSGLASGVEAGTYVDSLSQASGTGLSNYAIRYVDGSLTIDPVASEPIPEPTPEPAPEPAPEPEIAPEIAPGGAAAFLPLFQISLKGAGRLAPADLWLEGARSEPGDEAAPGCGSLHYGREGGVGSGASCR